MVAYPTTRVAFELRKFVLRGLHDTDIMFKRWRKTHAFYELDLLQAIRKYKRRGCYIDIGANLGNHAIFFTNFCPVTALIAVESHPVIYEVLLRNLAANVPANIKYKTVNSAVLDTDNKQVGLGEINPYNVGSTVITDDVTGGIATVTIDTLTAGRSDIAVIKMDIEGCERRALAGATATIDRWQPLVAMEAGTPDELRQLTKVMQSFNYSIVFKTPKQPASYLWVPKD